MDGKLIAFLAATLLIAGFALVGCMRGAPCMLDYDGMKACYKNADSRYAAGSTVKLTFTMAATDTDYTFYLDGEPVEATRHDSTIDLTFTMPDHDAKLTCESRNTSVAPSSATVTRGDFVISHAQGVVATVGGDRSTTLSLYTCSDPHKAWLNVHSVDQEGRETGDPTETFANYLLPVQVIEDCRAAADAHQFTRWDKMKLTPPPCGGFETVCYALDNGDVLYLGPSGVPEGHEGDLYDICEIITSYSDQYETIEG